MVGDGERAVASDVDDPPIVTTIALDLMGRRDDAMAHARKHITAATPPLLRSFFEVMVAMLEGRHADALDIADRALAIWALRDPCANYYLARMLAALDHPSALAMLRRAVEGGFYCYPFFARDPRLDPLRTKSGFTDVLRTAEAGYRDAVDAFVAAGGEQILGPLQRD
jgi:hypothetical protein